jgi:transcriptional antiterminator RfaH
MNEMSEGYETQSVWYAVRTRPRHERVVKSLLTEKKVKVFLPEHRVWSCRCDRRETISVPLFPSYLFVASDSDGEYFRQVKWTRGVINILGVNGRPLLVPNCEIESIQILMASGESMSPVSTLVPGNRVRVIEGPLIGAEGKVVRRGKRSRLIVTVEFLQRSVAVELAEYQLEKVKNS